MTRALFVLLLAVTSANAATYVHEECAFRFEIPAGWEVAPRDPQIRQHCAVTLRPAGKKRAPAILDVDAVNVATMSGVTFETAAHDAHFMLQADGSWKMFARTLAPRAATVRTDRWRGVRGSSDLGCYGPRARLAKLCTAHHAVVQAPEENGRIVIVKSHAPGAKALDAILDTFTFTGPGPDCERRRDPDEKCAALRLAAAEAEMEKAYARVLAAKKGEEKAKLEEEQKQWRSVRAGACEAHREHPGGVDLCRARLALQRIEELDRR